MIDNSQLVSHQRLFWASCEAITLVQN